jgi:hypothetical protein
MNKFLVLILFFFEPKIYAQKASSSTTKPAIPSTTSNKKNSDKPQVASKSAKPKRAPAPQPEKSFHPVGFGLDLGTNASFGNALKTFLKLGQYVDLQLGLGYNTTGGKIGLGTGVYLPVSQAFASAMIAGVYSRGVSDKVSIDAKFTPEGTTSEENVKAMRKVRVSDAQYISANIGGGYNFTDRFRIQLNVNYNKVLKGNQVEFEGSIEYDTPVESNNESQTDEQFRAKALEKLNINGVGISGGFAFFL